MAPNKDKNLTRIVLLIIFCFWVGTGLQAQKLTVEGMTASPMDLSASQYERKDLVGQNCGLVKVQLADEGAKFEGNVLGKVEYKTGEYWAYMTQGAYMLRIKHPKFVPLDVNFRDYGISGVEGKVTYTLTLQMGEKMQKLIIDYTPKDALVLVDSKPYLRNGHLELMLSVGSHDYVIAKEGYTTIEGVAKLNKDNPRRIVETLQMEKSSEIVQTPMNQQDSQVSIANKQEQPVAQPIGQAGSSVVSQSQKETITVGSVSFDMIRVDGGTFRMGATSEQGSDASDWEKPAHQETLSSYYIGETEVTQELWEAVMGSNPSTYKGAKHPVERVSWNDCQDFIRKLNAKTGRQFRLPTEAEWEYAARGGNKSKGYKYSGSNEIDKVAWYGNNSGGTTHDVGRKSPNELGLYDMSGNAWEWCEDWYGAYSSSSQSDPKGPSSGSNRVCRGGSWFSLARDCRVSYRNFHSPGFTNFNLGLRLAL